MNLNDFEPLRKLFEEALKKYGKEELAQKLSCSVASIYSINLGRFGLPERKIKLLCEMMGQDEIWEQFRQQHKEPALEEKRDYIRNASNKMAFLKKFDGLTPYHQNLVIQRILELENEEYMEGNEGNANQYLYEVSKDVQIRMEDPTYTTSQVFYDAEKRFGHHWLLRRFELRRSEMNKKELTPELKQRIIRYICAYDKYVKNNSAMKERAMPAKQEFKSLEELQDFLESEASIPRNKGEWGGAEVIITSNPERRGYTGDTIVLTEYARELTWLFYQLKEIFNSAKLIDHCSKFEFYGRLGRVANQKLEETNKTISLHGLCKAVFYEAIKMKQEIETGKFEELMIAPPGIIAADLDEERK